MNALIENIISTQPKKSTIALFWLGQAGFIIKTASGARIGIDPYLSDYVERSFPEMGFGFKRLMPPPCPAEDLHLDYLLISHEHADHYDADSIKALIDNGNPMILTTPTVAREMQGAGFDLGRVRVLRPRDREQHSEFNVTVVDCDHGELSSDAIGFVLDFGFLSVYYAGDTALTPNRLEIAIKCKPDIAILPINGAFGNLDGEQAATLVGVLQSKYCIPCHFWMFPLHMGNPQQIIDSLPQHAPHCRLCLFQQGEGMIFPMESPEE